MTQEFSQRDTSSTFAKGIAVLRAFDDRNTSLTLAAIARMTGLDRAAVRRLMLTLVDMGYAYRHGNQFSLSPKVLTLAGSFLRGHQFGSVVQPLLNRYASQIQLPVSLAIVDEESAVYIAQATLQESEITFGFTVGSRLPLLHTAIGRALLSVSESGWVSSAIASIAFERYTSATVMNRRILRKTIAECKNAGSAVVTNEFEAGVTGIAVPVDTTAAVGTSCDSSSLKRAQQQQIISQLTRLSRELVRAGIFAKMD
jgi:IclR family pca regulon transcriptional regulator